MTALPRAPIGAPHAKPFNVMLVQPAGFIHSLALKEAADYIHAALQACGYRSMRSTMGCAAFDMILEKWGS